MKYKKILYSLMACSLFGSCTKETLDRPPLTNIIDNQGGFWRNEDDVRIFANTFYTNYFNGFNTSFTVDYTPVRGYTFSDDLTGKNVQANFESTVPTTRGSTNLDLPVPADWLGTYAGPTWDFAWVRKSNIMIDRLDNVAKPKISAEAYNH